MKFSKEINDLINYSISDGNIGKKEKHLIYKQAITEGIDLDELEIYLQSKIYALKTKNDASVKHDSSKLNKLYSVSSSNKLQIILKMIIKNFSFLVSFLVALMVFIYFSNLIISVIMSIAVFGSCMVCLKALPKIISNNNKTNL
jgi:hypothetical protein